MDDVSNESRSARSAISDARDFGRFPRVLVAGSRRKYCRSRVWGDAATDTTHAHPISLKFECLAVVGVNEIVAVSLNSFHLRSGQ